MEAEIGNAAGKIWQALHSKGSMPKAQVAKATGLSADLFNQGLGWLAREGKLTVDKGSKGENLKLRG
jgi:hypothetical protein